MLHVDSSLKQLVQKQLEERAARSGSSGRPITTVKGTALFDLQFRAEVEGHSFIADERSGGHDAGPAPLRYFVAGIMFCHQVWTVKTAALMDFDLESLGGEISIYSGGGDSSPGETGLAWISYTVSIDSKLSDDDVRTVVEQATSCTAFQIVANGTRIELTLKHNGKKILERVYSGSASAVMR